MGSSREATSAGMPSVSSTHTSRPTQAGLHSLICPRMVGDWDLLRTRHDALTHAGSHGGRYEESGHAGRSPPSPCSLACLMLRGTVFFLILRALSLPRGRNRQPVIPAPRPSRAACEASPASWSGIAGTALALWVWLAWWSVYARSSAFEHQEEHDGRGFATLVSGSPSGGVILRRLRGLCLPALPSGRALTSTERRI
jgi:hypothetical protein